MTGVLTSRGLRRLAEPAAIAVAYYALGSLGLLLAIHPGYAAVVWPASGIALAGTLLFGSRIWPGILLGSFLVNILTSLRITDSTSILSTIGLTISIGIGAVVQALAGAFLIRRFTKYPTFFIEAKDVIKFLLLGGPLSCLVSATWGVTSLLLEGVIRPVDYLFHWWIWWVGDSIGVVAFAPLALIWVAKMPAIISLGRKITVTLALCLGLAVIVTFFFQTSAWEKDRMKLVLERQAYRTARQLQGNIEHYIDVLHAMEGLYTVSANVSREQFRNYVSGWFPRHQGIRALLWNPRIFDSERMTYEQAARSDGVRNFQIKEQDSDGKWVPAARRAEYLPTYYMESLHGNRRALGFDGASDPSRLQALNQARDTGKATATDPLTLLHDIERQPGFLVFLPVYRSGLSHDTVEERRLNLRGYVSGVFRISDVMDTVLRAVDLQGVEVRLYDRSGRESKRLLYDLHPHAIKAARTEPSGDTELTGLRREVLVEVADRQWLLEFTPTREYLIALRQSEMWGVPALGLIFIGISSAFLLLSTGQNSRLQTVNTELENEIAKHKAARADLDKFAVIVDCAEEAIIGTTWGEAVITTWNKGAERLYGYSTEEAVGRSISILHPPERPDEQVRLRQQLKLGEHLAQYETVRLRKNGTRVHVSLTLSLMKDATGTIVGVASIGNDISARKAAESKLQQQREAVAQRLHDSVLQSLTAIGMHLKMAQELSKQHPQMASQHLATIERVLTDEQQDLRFYVGELKGTRLGKPTGGSGQLAALEKLVNRLESQWDVRIELEAEQVASWTPEHVVHDLLYIIQEGVSNAVRHGHASRVQIKISCTDEKLVVRIIDNGCGFPLQSEEIALTGDGAVPRMLRNRSVSLGGSLSIYSSGAGASVEILLPLSQRGAEHGDHLGSGG